MTRSAKYVALGVRQPHARLAKNPRCVHLIREAAGGQSCLSAAMWNEEPPHEMP
jgi:hypothetical protein